MPQSDLTSPPTTTRQGRTWTGEYLRSIFWQFTRRNLEQQLKGSLLGLFWLGLAPLLMLGLYTVVFGFIFEGSYGVVASETKVDYALGIFLGLSLHGWIANTLGASPVAVVSQPNLVKRVVFPLQVLPAAVVAGAAVQTLVSLLLCFIGVMVFGSGLSVHALWMLYIIAACGLMSFGLGWMLGAAGVFFRDIGQLVPFFSLTLLYCSAVFYSVSKVDPQLWAFLRFNPLIHAIDGAHRVVLWQQWPTVGSMVYLGVSGLVIFGLGYWIFMRLHRNFADVL